MDFRINSFKLAALAAFEAVSAPVTNSVCAAREFALNSIDRKRTFRDMSRMTGHVTATDFYTPPSRETALDTLERAIGDNLTLRAQTAGKRDGERFEIIVSSGMQDWVALDVTGETTNGDFFKLADTLGEAATMEEVRQILAEKAPEILGEKLRKTDDSARRKTAAPAAETIRNTVA